MYNVVYVISKETKELICYKAFLKPKEAVRYAENLPDSCTTKIERKDNV